MMVRILVMVSGEFVFSFMLMTLNFNVLYEGGTEETIKIYVTKEYIIEF